MSRSDIPKATCGIAIAIALVNAIVTSRSQALIYGPITGNRLKISPAWKVHEKSISMSF